MSTDTGQVLLAARAGAIHESGWGARFRFFQPRNLAFWVYVFLVGYGAFVGFRIVSRQSAVYGGALIVAAVLFGVYGALFWWFTQHIDRYAHQSSKLIVLAVGWGAFAATLAMAANANTPILGLWAKAFGQTWSLDWGAGLTAPFVEETAKGSGLLLLIALAPRLVNTAFDGFILGAFIGLGFQITEDIQYALTSAGAQFGANPIQNALSTIAIRIAAGVASHILFSSVFGAGLVYFLGRPAEPRRRGLGLVLMAAAMLMHGLWDDVGGIVGGSSIVLLVAMLVLIVVALFVVTRVFNLTVPRERAYMRAVMAPEVAAGTVTAEELDALAGDRRARKAYRKAAQGHDDKRRRGHLLQAAHDLADELARAGGQDGARVTYARSELRRLRG